LQKRGHPHPLAGIRNGYPSTISRWRLLGQLTLLF
jgi:hypothetical protein